MSFYPLAPNQSSLTFSKNLDSKRFHSFLTCKPTQTPEDTASYSLIKMHYKLRVTFVLLLVFVSCEANVNSSTRGDESADTKEQNCSKADECLVESTTSESRLVRGEAMTNFEGDFGLERKDVRDARVQVRFEDRYFIFASYTTYCTGTAAY